jgi:hypothetical protein
VLPSRIISKGSVAVTDTLDNAPGFFAKLYLLAQKYEMPRLQENIIDAFIQWINKFVDDMIPAKAIQYVWEKHEFGEMSVTRIPS